MGISDHDLFELLNSDTRYDADFHRLTMIAKRTANSLALELDAVMNVMKEEFEEEGDMSRAELNSIFVSGRQEHLRRLVKLVFETALDEVIKGEKKEGKG